MKDEYYMEIALKEAKKAYLKNDVPVGAVVVLNDKIIGRGYNQKAKSHDVTSHAELIAIRRASKHEKDWRLLDATIYITMSPCPMCASAIMQSRIKRIVIGALNPDVKQQEIVDAILMVNQNGKGPEVTSKVLETKAVNLLQSFFQNQRKKN